MPKINLLSKETAELIAAGEVVERPASAIKEIIENSIDAGARHITIEIERGGIVGMKVTDDGCGIPFEEVPIAFLRHATSKISTASDLDKIGTLGFRGEALAAISTVAKVEMHTKTHESNMGTRYVIEGGTEVYYDEAGCPNGTTIEIRELFYNTPARMKFLKKDIKEGANVAAVVDRMALSHPEISFRFIRDGKQVLLTQGNGKLQDAVYAVLGRDAALGMLPMDYSVNGIRVSGLICKPFKCRPNRNLQIVFLNGRFVKSACVMAALDAGYKNSAMVGKFPYCVINLEVPFEVVDVNVHPAKTEVRFSDESRIFDCVHYGVKNALEGDTSRPEITNTKIANTKIEKTKIRMTTDEFLREMSAENKQQKAEVRLPISEPKKEDFFMEVNLRKQPLKAEEPSKMPNAEIKKAEISEPPVAFQEPEDAEKPKKKTQSLLDMLEELPDGNSSVLSASGSAFKESENAPNPQIKSVVFGVDLKDDISDETLQKAEELPIRFIGELFRTYIMIEQGDKLLLIDKHATHERILYEELKKTAKETEQMLLNPATLSFEKNEYIALVENCEKLLEIGFDIEDFGDGTIILRSVPSKLAGEDYLSLLSEVAESLMQKGSLEIEKLDRIYHTMACKAATKAGAISSEPQLLELAKRAVNDPKIRYCPHGRPVAIELTKSELERMFGRIQ